MSDLAAFLLARIAEDARDERARLALSVGLVDKPTPDQDVRLSKSLAAQQIELRAACRGFAVAFWSGLPVLRRRLRLLALPYASHPDYRAEWRPASGPGGTE